MIEAGIQLNYLVVPWPRPLASTVEGEDENLAERESKCLARSDQYQDSNLRAAVRSFSLSVQSAATAT